LCLGNPAMMIDPNTHPAETSCQFASNCDPLFASNRDPSGAWDLGLSM
jgi:hypothetical protein